MKHLAIWPSGCLKQEDFPARQEPVQSHLPNGLGPRQICQLCKETELALARGKQNLRPAYPKCKLAFYFFRALILPIYSLCKLRVIIQNNMTLKVLSLAVKFIHSNISQSTCASSGEWQLGHTNPMSNL